MLEFLNFTVLFAAYVLCLFCERNGLSLAFGAYSQQDHDIDHLHALEILFIVLALGFALDEYTSAMEHGWGSACS